MYPKGGNMLHTIRQLVGDDERWRGLLRGLGETFGRQTVTGRQIQEFISERAGIDLSKVFEQYLRTIQVPVLEYRLAGTTLSYRCSEVVPGFDMPVGARLSDADFSLLHPTGEWQTATLSLADPSTFAVDPDYYVIARDVTRAP